MILDYPSEILKDRWPYENGHLLHIGAKFVSIYPKMSQSNLIKIW